MATHEIKPYANLTRSKEKAPFLAVYQQKKTVPFDELITDVAKESGMTDTEVRTILEGTPEIIEELEREMLTRIRLPGGIMIEPTARGTLDAVNSAWDSERNSLELSFRMDENYRNHLVNATPTIVTDVTITKADIHRVFDVAVPLPTNLIHGQNPFRIQGKKLFPKTVYLVNALQQRFDCDVLTTDPDGNAYEAMTRELLEPGDYKLVVETNAGEEEGILQYPQKSVKYLCVPPTELKIVKVHSTKLAADDTVSLFNDDSLIETNMPLPADSTASVRLVKIATGQVLGTLAHRDGCTSTMIDEKTIKVHLAGNTSEAPDGSWQNMEGKRVEVIVNTPTDSCVREVLPVISEE